MKRLVRPESLPIRPEQIEAVLERCDTSLDWATGFLAAVHTGPDVIPLSDWITHFTLEEAFLDNEEATRAAVTLVHLYGRIGELLATDVEALCPDPEDIEGLEHFCEGYVAGARLHTGWRTDRLAMGALTVFALLGGLVPPSEIKGPDGKPRADMEDWLARERADLKVHVRQTWRHWAPARKVAEEKARVARQAGRNDACPCGSGKKYKKCCLAA